MYSKTEYRFNEVSGPAL